MTNFDWIKKHVKELSDGAEKVGLSAPNISYGPHTALKIAAVKVYAAVFAKIAGGERAKRANYDGAVYVGLFAGPGLVKCTKQDVILGSPLAVASNPSKFDEYVFVESDRTRADALRRSAASLTPGLSIRVFDADCNSSVRVIIEHIASKWKKPLLLVFVDPEGMEVKFSTIKAISDAFEAVDYIINFTTGTERVRGRLQAGMASDSRIFGDFFGEDAADILDRYSIGEPLSEQYQSSLAKYLGRTIGSNVPVRAEEGRDVYHLLFATRLTTRGSEWKRAFSSISKRLEGLTGRDVVEALDLIKGRSKSLDSVF